MRKYDPDALVAAKTPEGQSLEFKRELYGTSDADNRELLKDISALANASGGTIIFGVEEAQGRASAAPGLGTISLEKEQERLTQALRSNLDPPIRSVRVYGETLADGRTFLFADVPESELAPHRTTFKGWTKFFHRVGNVSLETSTAELRDMFLGLNYVTVSVRDFVGARRKLALAGTLPVPVVFDPYLLLHVCPKRNFGVSSLLDALPSGMIAKSGYGPPRGMTMGSRHNLEGQITWSGRPAESYVQLFRNGSIELFSVGLGYENEEGSWALARYLCALIYFRAADLIARANALIGVDDYAVSVVVRGLENSALHTGADPMWRDDSEPMPHNELVLPDLVVPASDDPRDLLRALSSNCHVLWQCWGFAHCPFLDDAGLPVNGFRPGFATSVWGDS